ncbi:peptidyl-prolyl cis-trans isomerase A1-like [Teleopsis dalmanni]|uniref:peptidyl-prolyl cis-trans isomerase A1-like n=1 Tax=Teleopsis dalmanni TaxID=139649 RepID=UPI0018CE10DC|nr:peptidyl-prolyl cis-trans isomerase A1-like [Teleopsis dalmanni]XP_037941546.1 peptidyl-prolyl cis-trans isomerase A1-like [Teleopsis dalmanni]XP_037956842.1 peptidyl-prolyl cis-trans isomerase A1-like [Teleopsis dalmanni]
MSMRTESEHHLSYQAHLRRIKNAHSIVKTNPPIRKKLEKKLTYFELLEKMSGNVQRKTTSRTFSRTPEVMLNQRKSVPVQGNIKNNETHKIKSDILATRKRSVYDVPAHIYSRYDYLADSCDKHQMRQLLRPRIFLDLEVKGIRSLGRLVIQLFTEACPEVVLDFVRVCTKHDVNKFKPFRFFAPLWCESELQLDNNSLTSPNAEHDMNVLDQGMGAGVLSFPIRYIRGCAHRSLNFSISFKPIKSLNGKRIAFGKVRRGNYVLQTLQDYCNSNYCLKHDIIVTKCGLVK